MLVEISKVDHFRALVDWAPDRGSSGIPARFGKWSVIYGGNGTGKSTVSELLRLCGEGAPPCAIRARTWDGAALASKHIGPSEQPLGYSVRAFNSEYVRRNLSEFLDGSGHCNGLVYIGEATIESARRAAALREVIKEAEGRLVVLAEHTPSLEAAPREALDAAKSSAISALEGFDPREFNPTRYNITKVKANFEADWCREVAPAERIVLKQLVATTSLNELTLAEYPDPKIAELFTEVNGLVTRPILSSVDPVLREDPDRERWVETGLRLHNAGDTCKYCGSPVSPETIARYEAHFDTSLTALRADLSETSARITSRIGTLTGWRDSIPAAEEIEAGVRDGYRLDLTQVVAALEGEIQCLDTLREAVQAREAAPFTPMPPVATPLPPTNQIRPLTEALAKHETSRANLAARRDDAALRLHGDALVRHKAAYDAAVGRHGRLVRAVDALKGRAERLRRELSIETESRHDTSRLARELSSDLGVYLGHDQLRIEVSPDGKAYRVLRSNRPAENLSDGERNSLALLYFLRSLEESPVDPDNTIVVVDDPVSSLDKEAIFAAYSMLRERLDVYRQAILLTHDFEFFRLCHLGLRSQYREEVSDSHPDHPRVTFLEFYAQVTSQNGAAIRALGLRELNSAVLRHPTEYHYLFWRLARALSTPDDPELPLLPNAGRRLLEGFLSFKAPGATDLRSRLDQVAAHGQVDAVLKDRVYRFANGLSHREEPSPRGGLDFPAIARELAMLMEFLRVADAEHFRRMEAACGITVPPQHAPIDARSRGDSTAAGARQGPPLAGRR